jgi:tRNA threonylcarbamoyladenosine biosynthesis protein TsaE
VEFPFTTTVNDERDTEVIAVKFAEQLSKGQVTVLNGNLGAGKTFFIKKVMQKFGVNYVNSPSFAIVNEYDGKIKAYHFDFYRLKKLEELYDIGWQDYLNDDDAIIFVEWGELLSEALPKERFEILITILDGTMRKFEFKKYEATPDEPARPLGRSGEVKSSKSKKL